MCLSSLSKWTHKALAVELQPEEEQQLERLASSRSDEARLVQRAQMILQAAQGASNLGIAALVGTTTKTVRTWRQRYLERRKQEPDHPVRRHLEDATREGAPGKFTAEQMVDLLALATALPKEVGVPITQWSCRELAQQAEKKKIVKSIHYSTVSRFLGACELKPHRVKEWMNRKHDPEFEARAQAVKQELAQAVDPAAVPGHAVVSYDEKTGIQALERVHPDKPMQPGRPVKREFEYRRHGTLTLLGMMLVNLGQVFGMLLPQRTNEDTAQALGLHLGCLMVRGFGRITVVLDQLNTHMSLEMIQVIAGLSDLPQPEPADVQTMKQRRAWLEGKDKPIVFLFTPKHASWLNPIELWFGVLVRKVLRRGSFCSVEDLRAQIEAFMEYYNERLAHPYKLRQLKVSTRRAA